MNVDVVRSVEYEDMKICRDAEYVFLFGWRLRLSRTEVDNILHVNKEYRRKIER